MGSFSRKIARNISHDFIRELKVAAMQMATVNSITSYSPSGRIVKYFIDPNVPGVVYVTPASFAEPTGWKRIFASHGELQVVGRRGHLTKLNAPWGDWSGTITYKELADAPTTESKGGETTNEPPKAEVTTDSPQQPASTNNTP